MEGLKTLQEPLGDRVLLLSSVQGQLELVLFLSPELY